jgi:hypothetical protein
MLDRSLKSVGTRIRLKRVDMGSSSFPRTGKGSTNEKSLELQKYRRHRRSLPRTNPQPDGGFSHIAAVVRRRSAANAGESDGSALRHS